MLTKERREEEEKKVYFKLRRIYTHTHNIVLYGVTLNTKRQFQMTEKRNKNANRTRKPRIVIKTTTTAK